MEYQTYESTIHGFSLDRPKGWGLTENSGFAAVVFRPSDTTPNFNMNVSIQDLKASSGAAKAPTPEEFLEISIKQIEQMGAKNLKYGETTIGGQYKGNYMNYTLNDQERGLNVKIDQSFFINGSLTYVVTLSVSENETDKYLPCYKRAVESFRLFKSKGIKSITCKSMDGMINLNNNNEQSYKYIIYSPKLWKKVDTHQKNQFLFSSNDETGLHLQVSIDQLKAPNNTPLKFNHWIKERMEKAAVNNKVEVTDQRQIEKYLDLSGLNHAKYSAIRLSFTSQTMPIKGDYEMVCVIVEDHVFTFSLVSPAGDMNYYADLLSFIVGAFRLSEVGTEHGNVDNESISTYQLFINMLKKYRILIPSHFEMSEQFSNITESVMFTSDKSSLQFPVFSMTVEDLGMNVSQEQYKGVILQLHQESMENARILSDSPSRIGPYKATLMEMNGFDRSITPEIIRSLFKCGVVSKRYGVLMALRCIKPEFEKIHSSSFYIFDSFKTLN